VVEFNLNKEKIICFYPLIFATTFFVGINPYIETERYFLKQIYIIEFDVERKLNRKYASIF
jgi:hypothetical protein